MEIKFSDIEINLDFAIDFDIYYSEGGYPQDKFYRVFIKTRHLNSDNVIKLSMPFEKIKVLHNKLASIIGLLDEQPELAKGGGE